MKNDHMMMNGYLTQKYEREDESLCDHFYRFSALNSCEEQCRISRDN